MTPRPIRARSTCILLALLTGAGVPATAATRAIENVRAMVDDGRYARAADEARALLSELSLTKGADSLDAARVADLLVESLWRGGRAAEAESLELSERTLATKRRLLGDGHLETTVSLRNLAAIHAARGDLEKARTMYEQVVRLREGLLGRGHPDVADALVSLGSVHRSSGDYRIAGELYDEALIILRRALGPEHIRVAQALYNRAILSRDTGDYDGSRRAYDQALAIANAAVGSDHLFTAWIMNGLANLHDGTGDYRAAEPLYRRSLEIREAALGPDHVDVALARSSLGFFLRNVGDYAGARPLLEGALEIRERALGASHPLVANSCLTLGLLLTDMADHEGALPLLERALEIQDEGSAVNSPRIGTAHFYLGSTLFELGELESSKRHLTRALTNWERVLGAGHDDVGRALAALARVASAENDQEQAIALFQRALAIEENSLGTGHPQLALTLEGLADALERTGDLAGAGSRSERALAIRERTLGRDHPLTAQSLYRVARLRAAAATTPSVLATALDAERIIRSHTRQTVRSLPERQALRYAGLRTSALDLVLSIAGHGPRPRTAQRRAVLEALIQSRALVLDEMAARQGLVSEIERRAKDLAAARQRYANLLVRGPERDAPGRYTSLLGEARRLQEEAEAALARTSLRLGDDTRDDMNLDDVIRELPFRGAVVAYARYRREATRVPGNGRLSSPTPSYLAVVLRSDEREILLVPLGEAGPIDHALSEWLAQARVERADTASGYRAAGETLRRMIWDPLLPFLRNRSPVFLVPDGPLNLLDFASLPAGERGFLIESAPTFHYLSAERDIVRRRQPDSRGRGLLAMGGPDFTRTSTREEPSPASQRARSLAPACRDFTALAFEPLPASAREVGDIVAVWKTRRETWKTDPIATTPGPREDALALTGAEASETAFKRHAHGRRILHLATHGFFLPESCGMAPGTRRGLGGIAPGDGFHASTPMTNPLVLSGLAFAGANRRSLIGSDEEDGVLTAEEIASLDLSGVEWAVLSACDTGAGEVRDGEGVFGLRRAFQIAGVGTLIMSLWPVDDEMARQWMRALYEGRFARHLTTAEAVREASLKLLRQRRAMGISTHPSHWSGFVAAGDWR